MRRRLQDSTWEFDWVVRPGSPPLPSPIMTRARAWRCRGRWKRRESVTRLFIQHRTMQCPRQGFLVAPISEVIAYHHRTPTEERIHEDAAGTHHIVPPPLRVWFR
jgi:hypothetical protein